MWHFDCSGKKYIYMYEIQNMNCIISVIPHELNMYFAFKLALHDIKINHKMYANNLKL